MSKSNYSRIIAGVMKWGVWGAQLNTTAMASLIEDCLALGVTTFDHADIYGGHTTEAEWGNAFQKSGLARENVQIITKCGIMMQSDQRPSIKAKHYDTSKGHIINSVDTSLNNLKTDYIDLLLIHRPSPIMNPNEIMKAIDILKTSGKIRHFGVSNFSTDQVKLINSSVDVECNQIEVSPFELSSFQDGTLDHCMLEGIIPMAWSPMGGGKLFAPTANPVLLNQRERLSNVAKKYDWELDQMVYLFLLHHPADIRPIVGSSKIERIKTAVDSSHTIISDAQWFEILSAATGSDVA
ncbi:MAG: putative oxidoreductase [Saprospiraceae bacterium]|jgi:predicted oxidoreductase